MASYDVDEITKQHMGFWYEEDLLKDSTDMEWCLQIL